MAQAEGVDRGVVNMNLQQKDSLAISTAVGVFLDGGNVGGSGGDNPDGSNGSSSSLFGIPPVTTSTTSSILNVLPSSTSTSKSDNAGNVGLGSTVLPSNTADAASTSNTGGAAAAESSQSKSGSGGGGGGIGTGAIVGIVVGVIGGLLLIGAVAFFLLRKRRQKAAAAGYAGGDSANTYMVDKETQGRATDSPNSPYTDENQTRNVQLEEVTRDEPPLVAVPRTSTSHSQGRGGTSGAQTPQGVSSHVAHLVEDGMTADEIRRLEEEERQLDDEIERAARR